MIYTDRSAASTPDLLEIHSLSLGDLGLLFDGIRPIVTIVKKRCSIHGGWSKSKRYLMRHFPVPDSTLPVAFT